MKEKEMKMTDKETADLVHRLEKHIESYDEKEYLGASILAAMKLMARGMRSANAGIMTMTLSDCWFDDNIDDKSHYKIVIKKLKTKPR